MSSLKWRGMFVLVVMVMEATAVPHQPSPNAFKRQKRQGDDNGNISDGSLLCLLNADAANEDPNSCGPNPLGPLPPPEEPLPPVGPFSPEEPSPPVGPFPPEEPLRPISPFPPEEPLPPVNPFPPEELLPPVNPFPPEEPLPPVDPFPPEELPPPVQPPPPDFVDPLLKTSHPPPPPAPAITIAPAPRCTCVPHWQCKDKKSATVVEGDSLTSVVLDLRSNLGCGAPEEVCCVHKDPYALPPKPSAVTTHTCGQRNPLGVSNSFYGFKDYQTQFGEFPWTVAVLSTAGYGVDTKPLYIGGGSLIHPQLVMSVAHKLKSYTPDQIKVRVGDWNLAGKTEAIEHQDIVVVEVLIQPGYSGHPYHYNDLVLLVLERPVILGPTVNTICLPLTEYDYIPHKCVVSGWGKKNFYDVRFQEVMKSVTMPLVNHYTCQAALHQTRLGPRFILHDSFMCAGGQEQGQDACTGDGGSPLVCPLKSDPSRYVQVGVVAWGIECGRLGLPGVYADVLKAGSWIDTIIVEKFGSSFRPRRK